jgi:hypothetical protein
MPDELAKLMEKVINGEIIKKEAHSQLEGSINNWSKIVQQLTCLSKE